MVTINIMKPRKNTPSCKRVAWRLIFLASVWLLLCNGDLTSWPFALPAIAIACWFSLLLKEQKWETLRLVTFCRYIPFFAGKSMLSGLDVMRRAFDPKMPLNPGLIDYPLSLPEGAPRVFLANSITLLPGTICADLKTNSIIVHTLDKDLPVWASLQLLESWTARIFRQSLEKKETDA